MIGRLTLTSLIAAAVLAAAQPLLADEAALEAVRDKITDRFERIERENIVPSPIEGWYAINQGPIVAYVSGAWRRSTNQLNGQWLISPAHLLSVFEDSATTFPGYSNIPVTVSFTTADAWPTVLPGPAA